MRKKVKRLKITEEMMNEIISADGGIISGGDIEYPGSSRIRTTTYSNKKDGMAWHTDNQRYYRKMFFQINLIIQNLSIKTKQLFLILKN